jgi:hypothetical protein
MNTLKDAKGNSMEIGDTIVIKNTASAFWIVKSFACQPGHVKIEDELGKIREQDATSLIKLG